MYRYLLLLCLLVFLFFGCSGTPKPIPDGVSPEVLLQMAQESVIKSYNNKHAIYYYNEFIIRFPEEIQKVVEAEYEIAFIHFKQNDFDTSKQEFEAIKAKYQLPGGDLLPRWPLVLTNKVLAEINTILAEKEAKKNPRKAMPEENTEDKPDNGEEGN
ncbi:MAG: hypothetical protein JW874_08800 [Spirochaetales bacterium]|nr:hypothetical protein [Spirochaetales bacterium]